VIVDPSASAPVRSGAMTLKVLTLNIWFDRPPWSERAALIRAWIDTLAPDVIGFQEVLRGPGLDQLAEIVGDAHPHRAYAPAMDVGERPGVTFGNAIASRWPLERVTITPLPDRADWEKRVALSARVEAPFATFAFTTTHLHWRFHHGHVRERQVVAVAGAALALADEDGFPAIVVGDFNAEPESDEIRYMRGMHAYAGESVAFLDAWAVAGEAGRYDARVPGTTWSNCNPYAAQEHEPDRRIDYVFAGLPRRSGVGSIRTCRVVCDAPEDGVWPTDHFGVYAELRTRSDPEA
jgi:endonuclease/exonuclease/phosphatase family metal-dependent hydrolase